MTLLIISFIAGVLTVLAPCILPLLPVIVGGSITEPRVNFRKALTIVISLGVSVILFTLILKASTAFIGVPPEVWQWISGGIIILLGIFIIFPEWWEKIPWVGALNRSSNKTLSSGYQKKSFWGDIIIGTSLGPVFTTCSPTYFIVLATVLPESFAKGFVYLLAYAVGLSISLLIIALVGQRIVVALGVATDPKGWFKRVLGILFLLVGVAIILGLDKKIQTVVLDLGFFDVTKVEQKLLEGREKEEGNTGDITERKNENTEEIKEEKTEAISDSGSKLLSVAEKQKRYPRVPEISSPDGFINTGGLPITLEEYRGKKVVLLDIWTYSCINCQRTLPYLNTWYEKYEDEGLVIVGLHTPEFAFERVQKNVEDAVNKFGIEYPVVLDNDYSTWRALGNQYWPRKYLIDLDGFIVYDHVGEGQYPETELEIQKALKELKARLGMESEVSGGVSNPAGAVEVGRVETREVYFGAWRNNTLGNGTQGVTGTQNLTLPQSFTKNVLYMGGTWNFQNEYAESQGETEIVLRYGAKDVYMVASSEVGVEIEVFRDGELVKTVAGEDVNSSTGKSNIKEERLYRLIEGSEFGEHLLRIRVKGKGLKVFTFTFG